jgi:hypothetical protein
VQWVNGTGTKWPGTAFYEEETAQELHFSGLNVIDTRFTKLSMLFVSELKLRQR